MNKLMKKFKQVGGKDLLYQYIKTGTLPLVINQVLIHGTSQKALEIVRNSTRFKIQKKLKKKFKYVLDELKKNYVSTELIHESSDIVWFCWFQGLNNAPPLVKVCYENLKNNLKDKQIVVITQENMLQYAQFPSYIMRKYQSGIISHAHFSDLLRLELLKTHGGMWIDATVLCTDSNIPKYMFESNLFLYQVLKPGRDGQSITISSWLMSASTNNLIIIATQKLLYEYWEKYNYLIEYGLMHSFMNIVFDEFPEEYKKIPKMCNSIPHILLLQAFEPFNEDEFKRIKSLSCFHKLTDKRPQELLELKGTYYDVLINERK